MNQPRKTKKIEIEIYEDEEADFLLSLINAHDTDISKEKIIDSISIPFLNFQKTWNDIDSKSEKDTKHTVRKIWRYFYKASKHRNAQAYKEFTGESFISFNDKKVFVMLWLIFNIWHKVRGIQVGVASNHRNYFVATLSNLLFNQYLNVLKIRESSQSSENSMERAKAMWNDYKFAQNGEYFFSGSLVEKASQIYDRNAIFNLINKFLEIIEKGQNAKDSQDIENFVIEILYTELKANYSFTNHTSNTIVGYVLMELGFLENEEKYDEKDNQSTWREYLKNNVENKIRNRMIIDRDKIIFKNNPLSKEEHLPKPLGKDEKSYIRMLIRNDRIMQRNV